MLLNEKIVRQQSSALLRRNFIPAVGPYVKYSDFQTFFYAHTTLRFCTVHSYKQRENMQKNNNSGQGLQFCRYFCEKGLSTLVR